MNAVAKTLKWQGRTLGLSKAYKQVPLNENAQAMCVLGDFHKGEWNYYTTSRLPFAATSAVYTFTRISRSIHHILCRSLRVLCTCFYDDFPALSTTFGAALVSKSMSVILGLLSWEPARVGTKAVDFACEFSALGITIKLQELHLGHFTLASKVGRIPKIVQMLCKIKQQRRISRNEAAEVHGHLNFAQGFFTSKSLGFVLGQFNSFSKVQVSGAAKRLANRVRSQSAPSQPCRPRSFQHVQCKDPSYSSRTVPGKRSVPQPAFSYTARIPGADSTGNRGPRPTDIAVVEGSRSAAHMPDGAICRLSSQVRIQRDVPKPRCHCMVGQ